MVVSRIGDYIGKTVRLDLATTEGTRARYARVWVEVDLSQPLLGKYIIDDRVFRIEYESLENLCYSCRKYGHKLDECPLTREEALLTPPGTEPSKPSLEEELAEPTGDWMTVSRRHRRKAGKANQNPIQDTNSGSRFSILRRQDLDPTNQPSKQDAKAATKPSKPLTRRKDDSSASGAPSPESMAKTLSEVLGKGVQMTPVESESRTPLKDVTNKKVGKAGTKKQANSSPPLQQNVEAGVAPIGDSELVYVPVMYENPVFNSNSAALKEVKKKVSRGKVVTTKPGIASTSSAQRSLPNWRETPSKPNHKFGPRIEPLAGDSSTSGRPPDQKH
ncbi:hypothetical protein LINPERPRIM_LOCUS29045 [Linum perenne]